MNVKIKDGGPALELARRRENDDAARRLEKYMELENRLEKAEQRRHTPSVPGSFSMKTG